MIKNFLSLEWNAFYRSASFGKGMAIKIVMLFFALFFIALFLSLGIGLYPALKKAVPEQDPLNLVNNVLFYWIIGDLLFRFFLQKLPIIAVNPLLILPIKRSFLVHYVLVKSATSFFNFLPLFAIIPFSVTLIAQGYPTVSVLAWLFTLILVTLMINFLNFIIESFSSEIELSFLPLLGVSGSIFLLNYFNIISFNQFFSNAFQSVYQTPIFIILPVLILVGLYVFNFKLLIKKLFLDRGLKGKAKNIQTSNLDWTRNFGAIAPFLQLDLKLIWRNKRTKSSVWMLLLGLFYGLFFYTQEIYLGMPLFFAFIGIFSTGIFLINFGQFIPAWDSSYYKLLMSQNIKYEQYLQSKFTLMVLSVIILFVLGIPYVFFGWKILLAHFAAAIYNIGVNSYVIMYGGSFNRKKIDLGKNAAFNYQGTGAVQWLIGIPLMIFPIMIFAPFYYLINFEIACLILALLGILGMAFHQKLIKGITVKYTASKYKMIDAFNQNNS